MKQSFSCQVCSPHLASRLYFSHERTRIRIALVLSQKTVAGFNPAASVGQSFLGTPIQAAGAPPRAQGGDPTNPAAGVDGCVAL